MVEKTKIRLVRNIRWYNGSKYTSHAIQVLEVYWGYGGAWRDMMTFKTLFFALRAFNNLKKNKDAALTVIEEAEVIV